MQFRPLKLFLSFNKFFTTSQMVDKTSPLWEQRTFSLKSKKRGCHLITSEIESNIPEIKKFRIGLLNLFLQHTSASLCLNENYDTDVRADMEDALNRVVPEDNKLYRHTMEGKDDMPAHAKSALVGVTLTIPIKDGHMQLGTWQGIWLCEHRDGSHTRSIVATLNGVGQ